MSSELERECERSPKVTADFQYGAASKSRDDMPNNWKVTLHYQGRSMTADFYGGSMVENPSTADVLYSLLVDTSAGDQSFSDFCGDFGYDEDSRSAEATWKACKATAPRLHRLLGADFGRFSYLEH